MTKEQFVKKAEEITGQIIFSKGIDKVLVKELRESLDAINEALYQLHIEGVREVIGKDEKKIPVEEYDEETYCDRCDTMYGGEYESDCHCDIRNQLRAEQREKLKK